MPDRHFFPLLTGLCWISLLIMPATAQTEEENFPQCLQRLQQEARQREIPEALVAVLGEAKELKRTIKYDRNQPEFVQTFAGYFNQRVTDYRIQWGRLMLAKNRELLNGLAQRYGIPAQYLVAFWGLESNFGNNIGKIPILDTLATLACDKRRSTFFTGELFSALELMNRHQFSARQMEGSWAGAIGQTQFMPSAFLKYGIDGDGDQRVDLWHNEADALSSAAYYLQQLGWQPALRWGREVQLPKDFPYHLAGIENTLALSEWLKLGVQPVTDTPLPSLPIKASLLVPAGANGPKFLVYDNFHIIMKWNRSQYYALAVGHLADRINGAGALNQEPPQTPPLSRQNITEIQTVLKDKGFYNGEIDGQLGPQSRQAIRAFQQSLNLVADGFADMELLQAVTKQ